MQNTKVCKKFGLLQLSSFVSLRVLVWRARAYVWFVLYAYYLSVCNEGNVELYYAKLSTDSGFVSGETASIDGYWSVDADDCQSVNSDRNKTITLAFFMTNDKGIWGNVHFAGSSANSSLGEYYWAPEQICLPWSSGVVSEYGARRSVIPEFTPPCPEGYGAAGVSVAAKMSSSDRPVTVNLAPDKSVTVWAWAPPQETPEEIPEKASPEEAAAEKQAMLFHPSESNAPSSMKLRRLGEQRRKRDEMKVKISNFFVQQMDDFKPLGNSPSLVADCLASRVMQRPGMDSSFLVWHINAGNKIDDAFFYIIPKQDLHQYLQEYRQGAGETYSSTGGY